MNSKQTGLIIGIAILIIIAIAVNNSTADTAVGKETKVSNSIHAISPVVYGNWTVWVDAEGIHGDFGNILLRNLSSGELKILATADRSLLTTHSSPAIYEDRVVWVEETVNGSAIRLYNISTNETSALIDTTDNPNPVIYEDLIVWQDNSKGSWDIYIYNISAGEQQQLTMDNTSDQMNPAIYEDKIVWQDDRNYIGPRGHNELSTYLFNRLQVSDFSQMWDIYIYNISTGEEKQITTHVSNQINPAIYSNTVVWQDYRNWNWDIYMYNLSSEETEQITTNESAQWHPAIYEDKIAWVDYNKTEFYLYRDIYMYNISTGEELQITDWGAEFDYPTETYWRGQPALYENKIVWSDERGGMENPQIFMFSLGEQTPPQWQEPTEETIDEEPTDYVSTEEEVNNPSEELKELQVYISGLEGVDTGTKSSLAANLNNAITMADKRDEEKSVNRLEKLIVTIEQQLLPNDRLSSEQAEYIIDELERIIELIRDTDAAIPPNNDSDDVASPANDTVLRAEGIETFIAYSGGESKSVIYGEWIAWENWRDMGPSEICLYDISSEEQLSLTPVSSQSTEPEIYGDKLIWRDFRHNATTDYIFDGIFLYDISTGEETPLIESGSYPDIYDNKIVWTDHINGDSDIYMYDISTGETEQVTTSGMANSAVIYGDTIAWLDDQNKNAIYTYSISTGEEKQIVSYQNPTHEYPSHLAIHGDRIVWQDHRNWNWDIYMYDLTSGEQIQITTDTAPQTEPSIYGDRIVWTDRRDNGNYEIYMYDISTGREYRVTDWEETDGMYVGWRKLPSIYQNRIIWFDERYGTQLCAIFMFTLGEEPTSDSQGSVSESVGPSGEIATSHSSTNETVVVTNGKTVVDNTTSEVIDSTTDESTGETVDNTTNESEVETSAEKNISSSTEESMNSSVFEENATSDSSEESTDESADNTVSESEGSGVEEEENISENATEKDADGSSEGSNGENAEDTYEEPTEESTREVAEEGGESTEEEPMNESMG